MKHSRNALAIVFFTVFVDMLSFGILIPIIPLLLTNPHSQYYMLPTGLSISQGYIMLGLLTASFPLMQFFATPILGQISDKFGRRDILLISLIGTSVSYALFGVGIVLRNIPLLFASRMLDGITGGNIAVAQAAIADISDEKSRVKNFGLLGAAFGLGFIVGPFIGGKLSDPSIISWFDAATPFWFATALAVLNVLSVALIFPETHKTPDRARVIRWHQSIHNIIHAFFSEHMRLLFTVSFLYMGGFTFFTTFFSVYLINKFNFNQGDIGSFFAYIGVLSAFTQIVIVRRVSTRFGEQTVLRFSFFGIAIGLFLYSLVGAPWHLYFVAPVLSVSSGLTMANLIATISKSADAEIQGEVLGINMSVQALAQSIPPMLSGVIAAYISPAAPLTISFLVMTCAGIVFLYYAKSHPRSRLHDTL